MSDLVLANPEWCFIFLFGYFLAGFIFYKTGSLFKTTLSFMITQITTVAIIYHINGMPFS